MNIIVFGNGTPVINVIESFDNSSIKVCSVLQDKILQENEQILFENSLKKHQIALNTFSDDLKDIDLIFVYNYNKIIDVKKFSNIKIINLHIGLLPTYRGNSANAWAILNGEEKVGYTIHEVNDELDDGDIFYKFEYNILNNKTYFEAKSAMNEDIKDNLSRILSQIFRNELPSISQKGYEFIYCSKLRPSDGIIKNWNISTDLILKKYYIFAKPLGTGLKFEFKNNLFEIRNISRIENFKLSLGIPGSIVMVKRNEIWVKTKDNAVSISQIYLNDNEISVNDYFKISMRLS